MSESPPCPDPDDSVPPRVRPLPIERPKPREDDPEAPERVRRILASPSYRRADLDPDLLSRDEMRGERLALEFRKVELGLLAHGVESTIVVFGGTRIAEPCAARRAVEQAEARLAEAPDDAALARELATARRVESHSRYYEVARELGRIAGRHSRRNGRHEWVVTTGGGPGIMEAANRGAFDVGAKTIGLNINLPREQFPNPYITPELCFQFRYFALRKMHFLQRARALVAFPGGYGTLDELFDALCLVQTRKIGRLPIVLVGRAFWERAFDADFLVAEGVIDPEDRELFVHAESAAEVWKLVSGLPSDDGSSGRSPGRADPTPT